jgi:hypothetical protein
MSSLEIELKILHEISTWPWAREAQRNLLLALMFPVIVWFLQRGLERLLGS